MAHPPNRPPNIILMITDQQRTDTMGAYGNSWIESPAQDALAAHSFVFENAYCTQPVCTPARGSLMTGLHPHSHGCAVNYAAGYEALAEIYHHSKDRVDTLVGLRDETPTIAEMLPAEYRKAHFGRWHLGNDPFCQHGFDEWISTEDSCRPWYHRPDPPWSDYHQWLLAQGFEPDAALPNGDRIFSVNFRAALPPECQMGAFLAGHSERFIRENRDRPWLLVFSGFEPHPPFTGPYNGKYDPADIPVGPAFMRYPHGHALFNRARADLFAGDAKTYGKGAQDGIVVEDLRAEPGWRKQRANYYGNVKIVDDAVARLVRALEETGQAADTVFALTSDHGEMLGDHGIWEKRAFYEESARVPMLISVPWMAKAQRRVGGNLGHVDLLPTLLELAGQPVPDELEGRSAVGAMESGGSLGDRAAVVEWNGLGERDIGSRTANLMASLPRRSIVSGNRWKLNLCAGDQGELFDLNEDPFELNNLYDDPKHRDRVREMAAELRLWQNRTFDGCPLPAVQ